MDFTDNRKDQEANEDIIKAEGCFTRVQEQGNMLSKRHNSYYCKHYQSREVWEISDSLTGPFWFPTVLPTVILGTQGTKKLKLKIKIKNPRKYCL